MRRWFGIAAIAMLVAACGQGASAEESVVRAPAAKRTSDEAQGLKTAIFAGGCFWGVEGVFSHVRGVKSVVSGYERGAKDTATYAKVSAGQTGHAEAVRVIYDPAQVRYDQLLQVFFSVVVDPTQLNRQGPDTGTQYRSALVPIGKEQAAVARAYLAQLETAKLWSKPVVTRVESHRGFYPAEAYHQDFMAKNPRHPYIQRWDSPKVSALKALYPTLYVARFRTG